MLLCFIIIGFAMYFVMQALAELGVMYPVNGAFFAYAYRVCPRPSTCSISTC